MRGLDAVYEDLDKVRYRLVRLTEMERVPENVGLGLRDGVLSLMDQVKMLLEADTTDDHYQ